MSEIWSAALKIVALRAMGAENELYVHLCQCYSVQIRRPRATRTSSDSIDKGPKLMKTILLFAVCFAIGMSPARFAAAQSANYPAKPIRWIVPFPPGGSVDTLARLAGARLAE